MTAAIAAFRHRLLHAGAALLALLLAACAEPLPPERADYVGQWESPGMTLLILQDGSVSYYRLKSGAKTTINGPLKSWDGNNFDVGIGFMTTTFEVSVPPHEEGGVWKMTVDGVELTRSTPAAKPQGLPM